MSEWTSKENFIRNYYCIPDGDKEVYKNETDFINSYQDRIFELMRSVCSESFENDNAKLELIKQKIMSLAFDVKNYVANCDELTVMRRLVFVENIAKEFKAHADLNYYDKDKAYVKNVATEIADFLTYIASETLLKDGLLDNLEEKLAQINLEQLKNRLTKFYDESDFNIISVLADDIYWAYSACLQKVEQLQSNFDRLNQVCGNCSKDDCTYCKDYPSVASNESRLKKYKELAGLLVDKFCDKTINQQQVDTLLKSLPVNNFTKVCEKVLHDQEGLNNKNLRQIDVKFSEKFEIYLQKDKIFDKIFKCVEGTKFNNLTSEQMLLLAVYRCIRVKSAKGDEIDKSFRKHYQAICKKQGETSDKPINFANLLEEYSNLSEEKKEKGE